mgnify:CR=1 FL=1
MVVCSSRNHPWVSQLSFQAGVAMGGSIKGDTAAWHVHAEYQRLATPSASPFSDDIPVETIDALRSGTNGTSFGGLALNTPSGPVSLGMLAQAFTANAEGDGTEIGAAVFQPTFLPSTYFRVSARKLYVAVHPRR